MKDLNFLRCQKFKEERIQMQKNCVLSLTWRFTKNILFSPGRLAE